MIKSWFLAVDAAGDGGDTAVAADTLVWLVAAGSASVNLAAVAKALGVEDTTRIRLANRQQLASSPTLCQEGRESDLVYSAKKFRLGPPLVDLPAPIDVVVMAELFDSGAAAGKVQEQEQEQEQGRHYVEVGFGRYVIMSSGELRRALAIAAGGGGGGGARIVEARGLQAPTGQRAQTVA